MTNACTGLVGLLILPLSDVAIGAMHSKFWKLNLAQVRKTCCTNAWLPVPKPVSTQATIDISA